jgi:hypothetical protein
MSAKMLSVRQPWASFIVRYGKDIENRSWKTNYRGRLVIHASKKPDPGFWDIVKSEMITNIVDFSDIVARDEILPLCGYALGVVDLVDCIKDSPSRWAEPGMWHWVLESPKVFIYPYQMKGALSLQDFAPPDYSCYSKIVCPHAFTPDTKVFI